MKRGFWLWAVFIFSLLLSGCGSRTSTAPTPIPIPTPIPSTAVNIDTVVIKKVATPTDRVKDFAVVELDGSYTVHFEESKCIIDDKPYLYGPYDSIKHCEILEEGVLKGIIRDQAWLDDELSEYVPYLNCIRGWVYLGRTQEGREEWFMEGFGFPAFCAQ